MPIDHTEIVPSKAGFDLKMFTDPQRSFGMTDLTMYDLVKIARGIHDFIGVRAWLVTVKLPKNPDHLLARKCRHTKFGGDGHCGEMGCANYISVCPRHALVPHGNRVCNREKVTAACPFSPYCTDKTGEHHTFLVYAATDGEALSQAENEMVARGYEPHITRIEVVG